MGGVRPDFLPSNGAIGMHVCRGAAVEPGDVPPSTVGDRVSTSGCGTWNTSARSPKNTPFFFVRLPFFGTFSPVAPRFLYFDPPELIPRKPRRLYEAAYRERRCGR